MKRLLAVATAAALSCALVGVASPAVAATTTAYSAAGFATQGTITPTATVSGSLGGLLGPILNPVLSGLVNPLLAGVAGLPQTLVSGLTSSLVGTNGTYASTPVSAVSQGSGFPSCTSAPWNTAGACYRGANIVVGAAPVIGAAISAANGYTENVTDLTSKPVVGAASTAVTALSLLGIPLLSGGTLTATSSCPTVGSTLATGTSTASNLSLLGGAITATTGGSGSLTSIVVNGNPLVNLASLNVGGLPVTVSLNGNLLKLAITLNVSQLLSGLGLSIAGSLLSDVTSSSLTLTVTVGPGTSTSASGAASAWGLEIGVDLAGSIGVNVLGLAGVALTIPSGLTSSGGGNVVDLKLAYTNCTATATGPGTQAVPPGVN